MSVASSNFAESGLSGGPNISDENFKNPQTHARAERSWLSRYGIPKWYKPCSSYPDNSVEFLKTWNIEGAVHINKGINSKNVRVFFISEILTAHNLIRLRPLRLRYIVPSTFHLF